MTVIRIDQDVVDEQIRPLLALLAEPGAYGRLKEGECIVVGAQGGVSVRRGALPASLVGPLLRLGLIEWSGKKGAEALRLTARGRLRLSVPQPARGRDEPRVNQAESPLAWLRHRRETNGEPFLDAACFAAGERLRQEITVAGLLPRVTADWSSVARGGGGRGLLPTEAVTAARQRVRQAFDAVGQELAGLLLDVCGFLKGLEEVERDRRWPPRSAKIVLRLALTSLARHYGLEAQAAGPARSRGIRRWRENRPFDDPPPLPS